MPQLPTYSSKGKLTTAQPEVTRTGAGQTEEAIGKAADAAFDFGIKWRNTQSAIQTTQAQADLE